MKLIKSILMVFAFVAFQITVLSQNKEGIIAFRNVNLITMTSEKVIANQTVLVNGNKIYKIGGSKEISIPEGSVIIDGTGKYLLPGLADMHIHFGASEWESSDANLYLANGVTTVRDLTQGSTVSSIKKWSEEFNSKKRIGPAIYNAWTIWGFESNIFETIPLIKSNGYNCLKVNSFLSLKDFFNVIKKAREMGIYTLGHIALPVSIDDVISSGLNELSHVEVLPLALVNNNRYDSIPKNERGSEMVKAMFALLEPAYNDKSGRELDKIKNMLGNEIAKFKGKDVTITTTLVCDESVALQYTNLQKIESRTDSKYIPIKFWDDLKNGREKNSFFRGKEWAAQMFYDLVKYSIGEIKRNGIKIVAGTDAGPFFMGIVPGFSLLDELKLIVESGYTPFEALSASTKDASKVIERMTGRDEFGTVEAGKRADLILLQNNPLENIDNIRNPLGVMTSGVWLDKNELVRLLDVKKKSIVTVLRDVWKNYSSVDSVIAAYKKLRDGNKYNEYFLSANSLTSIGYDLKKLGRNEDALIIFKLNAEEYPYNPNSFDCLGEIYLEMGDRQKAVEYYQQALKMDPSFDSSIKALKELGR